jgi:hypothetical protein
LLLRGGPEQLEELLEQVARSAERFALDGHPFSALSVTAVLSGETEDDLLDTFPLNRYRGYHRMSAGALYAAGFKVWATFQRNPHHFSVQLPAGTADAVRAFLAVAGPVRDNPRYPGD